MSTGAFPKEHPKQEPGDIHPRAVLLGIAGVMVTLLIVALIAGLLTRWTAPTSNAPENAAVARATRLSSDPTAEIAEFRKKKQSELNRYNWVDRKQGIASVPIDRAMEILVEQHSKRETR